MKIFTLNLKNKKYTEGIATVIVVLVIFLSVSVAIATKYFTTDLAYLPINSNVDEKIIIIDAGHGGEDPGAIGSNGIYEKDLNLEIALQIGEMLEKEGYAVIYTRTDDKLLYTEEQNIKGIRKISDLKNRCNVAKKYPEATFISIHMNSFGSEKYAGTQVYYSKTNENSILLAQSVQNTVRNNIQPDNNRNTKESSDIYLLNNISNPSILIECGFLTNKTECEKLCQKEYQKELSFSIVCGIIEYMDKNNKA